jgi:hypothetical protein
MWFYFIFFLFLFFPSFLSSVSLLPFVTFSYGLIYIFLFFLPLFPCLLFSFLSVCSTFFLPFLMFLSNLSLSLFLIIYSALSLCLIFLAHYHLKGKVKLVRLPCCLSPLINCEPICSFMKFSSEVMPRRYNFQCHKLNHSIMADVQTSEVVAKLAPVNMGSWMLKFGNHFNDIIFVWQLSPYLCNNGPHSWIHYFITVVNHGE